MEFGSKVKAGTLLKKSWLNPKRFLRAAVLLGAKYLEFPENRNDLRYHNSYIGRRVLLGEAVLEGNNAICDESIFWGKVKVGYASTLGVRSIVHGPVSIGRFCQLAPQVALYAVDHPCSYLTTYVNRRLFDGELSRFSEGSEIVVGSDVWIGHGSIILKGVKIGNGAIIGAGCVVTHDVPGYSVVVGNPARVLRKRFDEEIIELLERLAWWNLRPEELPKMKPLFVIDFARERQKAISLLQEALAQVAIIQGTTKSLSQSSLKSASDPQGKAEAVF